MARISSISVKQEPGHLTVTIRRTIDFMKEYAEFAGQAFEKTGDYLKELGLYPIDGPIVCFHNMALESLDVEIGWQIVQKVEDRGEITCNRVPSRRVVTAIDLGPYEEQDPTLLEILDWLKANGYEAQGPIYYCYLNDTERPPSEYLTKMSLPIR